MPRGNVRVSITGDADGLNRATLRAQGDLARFDDRASKSFSKIKAAGAAAGAAVGLFAIQLGKDSVKAAIDAERSQAQLQAQLQAMNISWRKHADEIDRVIQKTSLLSGLDDEDLADALTNIVRVTGDVNKALRLTGLAADVARAKHLDVAKAGEIVGKVAGGNIGILSRYGIVLKDGATATEALAQLQRRFGGQAEAYGKTTAGSVDRLRVAWENVQERLGKALIPVLKDAANWLARFLDEINHNRGAGGEFARTLTDLGKVAKVVLDVFRFWIPLLLRLPKLWFQVGKFGVDAARAIWAAMKSTFDRVKKVFGDVMAFMLRRFADLFELAGKLPVIGDKFDRLADQARGAADKVDRLGEEVKRLPKNKQVTISVKAAMQDFLSGDFKPLTPRPGNDGWGIEEKVTGGATAAIQRAIAQGKINPFGDVGALPLLGGGGLMGASPILAPFAAIGNRMGLHVSSGLRPGSITNSGNVSYHASGHAIDMADGPAGMLAYAKVMARLFGGRLKELIHSPLGFSIKNGRRVAPYAVADHYDHVHVALQRGGMVPGSGSGDKVPVLAEPGEGFINSRAVRALGGSRAIDAINRAVPRFQKGGSVGRFDATSYGPPWGGIQGTGVTATGVNLKGSPHLHGIAVDPSVLKLGAKYWVWPNPFNYRGPFKAFDTGGAIKGNRIDFYDWRGRSAQLGWGSKDVTVYRKDPWGDGKGPGGRLEDTPNRGTGPRNRRDRRRLRGRDLGIPLEGRDTKPVGGIEVGQPAPTPGSGGAGGSDPALEANTAAIQAHTDALNESIAQQARLEYLLNQQSPQILDQMRALISTSMMRTVTLGRQAAGAPGRAASL